MARKRIVEHAPRAGAAREVIMVIGKINRNQPRGETYPMFQEASGLLRRRGETVLDPSDEARSWTNETPYSVHVDHSLGMLCKVDAFMLLPDALDSRLAAVIVEYALMVELPILQMTRKGAVHVPTLAPTPPLWTARLLHRGEGKDVL